MRSEQGFSQVTGQLERWNRRRTLLTVVTWTPRAVLAGLSLALLLAGAARLWPLLESRQVALLAASLAGFGLVIGLVIPLLARQTLLEQARFADRQFRLQERATSAVELATGQLKAPPALVALQLEDTLAAMASVDVRRLLPLRLPWKEWLLFGLVAVLLLAAVLIPNPQEVLLRQQQEVAETIAAETAALEALRTEIQQNSTLSPEQQQLLQEPIAEALQALRTEELSQARAVAVLSEAEADLRSLSANQATQLQEALRSAAAPLIENTAGQELGQALQTGQLAAAGSAAAQLADRLPGLSPAEQAALAQDLTETAAELAQVDGELAQEVAEAAQALRNGNVTGAQEALRAASGTLQERAQAAAAAQQAGAAAERLRQGREAVAQAGSGAAASGQGTAAAESGQQGDSSSGGAAANGTSGSGGAETVGPGNGSGSNSESGAGGGVGGTGGETGHAENVFVPDFRDLSDAAGNPVELPAECIANPESCGALLNENSTPFRDERSSVPYDQVFADYRDAAYQALGEDFIPLGLKGVIRDYFSSLDPE